VSHNHASSYYIILLGDLSDPSTAAARIIRIEKIEIQNNGKTDKGYLVVLEGICRLRIERFTLTGTPHFEALVKAFPRKSGECVRGVTHNGIIY
jgi:hypothetical protein